MIESGLYQQLKAASNVTALVGENIFPLWRKDMPIPAILFQGVTGTAINSMGGESRLRIRRFQFDCYAPAAAYLTSRQISDAVRAALVPQSSNAAAYPYNLPDGTEIQSATVHIDMDMPVETGSGGYLSRALLDIEFVHIPA